MDNSFVNLNLLLVALRFGNRPIRPHRSRASQRKQPGNNRGKYLVFCMVTIPLRLTPRKSATVMRSAGCERIEAKAQSHPNLGADPRSWARNGREV
jgi:hypothetical protein